MRRSAGEPAGDETPAPRGPPPVEKADAATGGDGGEDALTVGFVGDPGAVGLGAEEVADDRVVRSRCLAPGPEDHG